jgi:hypothetical protein
MHGVLVGANTGRADAPSGVAQGGGIWNGVDLSGPDVQLTLGHSALLGNRIAATAGITPQGGGLYTTTPATLTATEDRVQLPGPVRRLLAGDADDGPERPARRSAPRLRREPSTGGGDIDPPPAADPPVERRSRAARSGGPDRDARVVEQEPGVVVGQLALEVEDRRLIVKAGAGGPASGKRSLPRVHRSPRPTPSL